MEVESKSVSIQTAVVEINTIKIDQKRMTLAVFRQIPEVNGWSVDEKDFWTFVNHRPTANDYQEWVIAVVNGVLRRFSIKELQNHYNHLLRDAGNYEGYLQETIKKIEGAIVDLEKEIEKNNEYYQNYPERKRPDNCIDHLVDVSKIHTIEAFDNSKNLKLLSWDQDCKNDQDYHLEDSKKRALEAIKNINETLIEVVKQANELFDKSVSTEKTFEALPHSYIAV